MIFKKIKKIKNKAIRIGVIWFIFLLSFTIVVPFLTMKLITSDYYFYANDNVIPLLVRSSGYSYSLAWPSEIIFEEIIKGKMIDNLDDYNEFTSGENLDENDFINMTEEKINLLDEKEFYRFRSKLSKMNFEVLVNTKEYYSVMVFSCGLSSFLLYLFLSLFMSNKNKSKDIDRD